MSLHIADAETILTSLKLFSVDFIALNNTGTVRPEAGSSMEDCVRTKRRGGRANCRWYLVATLVPVPKPWEAIASQDLCSAGFVDRYRLKVNCRTAANALQVFEGQACRGQGSRGAGAVRRFHNFLLRVGRHQSYCELR